MNAPAQMPIRRATQADIPRIARLFALAFAADPVFDWLARTGAKRQAALHRFFTWILERRTLPYGETWITADGLAAATWIPPYAAASPSHLAEDFRLLPVMLRLTGISRLARGVSMAAAMEHAHPDLPYFYLAFIAVAPRAQGSGRGSDLLRQTLQRADKACAHAYLENSNPRNLALYERAGFTVTHEIKARSDAPPVYAMWRPAKAS
jgi:ribosomal protein S18 acetylase RimI-like enzyme